MNVGCVEKITNECWMCLEINKWMMDVLRKFQMNVGCVKNITNECWMCLENNKWMLDVFRK